MPEYLSAAPRAAPGAISIGCSINPQETAVPISPPIPDHVLKAAADMAAAGFPICAIAARLRVGRTTLRRAEKAGRVDLSAAPHGKQVRSMPEMPDDLPEQPATSARIVPTWVRDPILREEYRENAYLYGEEGAASIARRQIAEMRGAR